MGTERQFLEEIRSGNRQKHQEDAVAKAAEELRRSNTKSVHSAEWAEQDGILYFRGKVYVPRIPDLRRRILELHHDSRIAGHPGRWKTLELVSRNYWWPQMSRYIGQYVKMCDLCIRTKLSRHAPVGELHPTPVPENRWETIGVDFIVELPVSNGYDAIMVVVDHLSKRAHFIPTHTTISTLGSARLYLHHVWKLHGLPHRVISDQGTQFVSEFTREVYRLLGI